jgi:hypothetical protein
LKKNTNDRRREDMRRLAVFTLILVLLAGAAYAKDYEVTKKVGEYQVEVKIDRNPPVVGENNVTVEVRDALGKYVADAKVKIEYSMPAMPGMPPMNYKADAEGKGDDYRAKINLSMAGSWNITVKITKGGKTSSMKFNIDAH